MDQIKLSSIGIIKFLYNIEWPVVVLVLVAITSSATAEPPPKESPPRKTGLKINTPMVIVLACFLTAFLLISIFFFYFSHCVERQLALASTINRNETRSAQLAAACGLDPSVIATFSTFTYSTVKEIKHGQHVLECAVCLVEFMDHEVLRLLPECNHVFHRGCIDEWLALRVTCPVCRASLVPKPNKLSLQTDMYCGPNGPTKSHDSVELTHPTYDFFFDRKLSRSYSMGHLIAERHIKDVDRYTLRLSKEAQKVLNMLTINPSTSPDVSNLKESGLKMSLKSASANFVRGSDYFDYERFGQEKRHSERNMTTTRSFNSHGGSDDAMASSQRFIKFVKSPMCRLFHISNKNTDTDEKLNPVNNV